MDLASRAPSAGKTQGLHIIALSGDSKTRFWDAAFSLDRRADFKWPGLFDAPIVTLWFADPNAYVDRYSEDDKLHTGLGAGVDAWTTPYWTVDASMSLAIFLLAAENKGLGALLFAVFNNVEQIRSEFGVPSSVQLLGAVAVGYPADKGGEKGRSATRSRKRVEEILRPDHW